MLRDFGAEVVSVTRRSRRVGLLREPRPAAAASPLMDVRPTKPNIAAAARGRWLPRHGADRGQPSCDLARHPHPTAARYSRRSARTCGHRAAPRRLGRSWRSPNSSNRRAALAISVGAMLAGDLVELLIPVPTGPAWRSPRPGRLGERREHRDRALARRLLGCARADDWLADAAAFERCTTSATTPRQDT